MRAKTNPKRLPEYELIRVVKVADSAPDLLKKSNGCNFGPAHFKACFQFIPINTDAPPDDLSSIDLVTGATSNPTIQFRFWNEAFGRFILRSPAITITAQGAGVMFEYELDVFGRIVMPEVTGGMTAGQGLLIFAGGHSYNEAL